MDEKIMAGLQFGTSLLGNVFGLNNKSEQMDNQKYLMGLQHKYNEESATYAQGRAYDMWLKTNYPAQVEQMEKAGLNPALMYGMGAGGGGTVSGAQGQGTSQPTDRSIEMKMKGQEMGLQLANLASQIKLNESQANKNNAEAEKTAGVDTKLAENTIENLISQTKNEKDRNVLIWADKRLKEATADMQEASAKLASGETAKVGYEIQSIMKSIS